MWRQLCMIITGLGRLDIRGAPSMQAIVEYLQLWELLQGQTTREEVPDQFIWKHTDNGSYSARSAYNLFFLDRTQFPGARELWSAGAPLKHKLHMCLVLKNRIWTADRLERRGLQRPQFCPLCCQEDETAQHLTLQCSYAREIWYHMPLPRRLHRFMPTAYATLDIWWPKLSAAVPANNRKELNALVILVSRELWLERNARVFDNVATLPMELCRRIKAEFDQWERTKLWKSGTRGGIT
jgi:hypothetical protein